MVSCFFLTQVDKLSNAPRISVVPDTEKLALDEPITREEIYHSIKTWKPLKAPGYDGMCLDFLKKTRELTKEDLLQIINEMYSGMCISDQQKYGIIVCIPKHPAASHIEDYRPLTFLDTDFNLLTRIIANRLLPWMPDLLMNGQYCGLMGNTVLEAITTIRDAIPYAEVTRSSLCVLMIDFQRVFGNLSHEYLFEVLYRYGFSERFRKRIWNIYNNSTSSVKINGYPFRSRTPYVRDVL